MNHLGRTQGQQPSRSVASAVESPTWVRKKSMCESALRNKSSRKNGHSQVSKKQEGQAVLLGGCEGSQLLL